MEWPDPLVIEIASRRCILFLGAGVSVNCVDQHGNHPPLWTDLLNIGKRRFLTNEDDIKLVDELIERGQLLDAAEIIFSDVEPADFTRFIRETYQNPGFKPTKIHEFIQRLDSKVVISTNYDQIYETKCGNQGYIVKKYTDEGILGEIRSPTRLIIKAHGCITLPEKMILTRSQYFDARMKNPSFYRILDSVFLTHTVLFIGCSLSDPDIQLILENTHISAPSANPHYAVMANEGHQALKKAIRKTYNIKLLEYENNDGSHANLQTALEDLCENVESYRSTYSS